ncbi:MAG: dihydropteroate synthase [Bacteroidaceae bacterium]
MNPTIPYSIRVGGRLMDLSTPKVMGILNVTPDSFYADSRKQSEADIARRVEQIMDEGGDIIDVGAYSSRPGAADVTAQEEMERLARALRIIRRLAPGAVVSIDTFRAGVARCCVEDYGAHIINDISGGEMDADMFSTVASLQVPYILMHMQGTPQTMQSQPSYQDVVIEVMQSLGKRASLLHEMGVCDVILDPGFGFGKTLQHNYQLLSRLSQLHELHLPLLVGVSRKSMIYNLLGCTPQEALGGTTVVHTIALLQGAHILRVHDVKAATEAVRIVRQTLQPDIIPSKNR